MAKVNKRSGPAGGGTVVTVEIVGGVPAGAAAAAKCRFGPTEIDSNPVLDGDTVVDASEVDGALECTSPPDTSDGRVVTLEVSLNAQEYSTGGGEFCYIAAPDTVPTGTARRTQVAGGGLDAITPLFGPTVGGSRIFARGADLVPHGCHWAVDDEPKECRFTSRDIQDPPNSGIYYSVIVPATVDTSAGRNALVCYSPPWEGGEGTSFESVSADAVDVDVSLNGRDWTNVQTYEYCSGDAADARPGCGPVSGATIVALTGRGCARRLLALFPATSAALRTKASRAATAPATRWRRVPPTSSRAGATPDLHSAAFAVAPMPTLWDPPAAVIDSWKPTPTAPPSSPPRGAIAAPVDLVFDKASANTTLSAGVALIDGAHRSPTSGLALLAVRGDDTADRTRAAR